MVITSLDVVCARGHYLSKSKFHLHNWLVPTVLVAKALLVMLLANPIVLQERQFDLYIVLPMPYSFQHHYGCPAQDVRVCLV